MGSFIHSVFFSHNTYIQLVTGIKYLVPPPCPLGIVSLKKFIRLPQTSLKNVSDCFYSLNHMGFPFLWSNGQIIIDFMWFNKIICYHKILALVLFLFCFVFYCFYMSVMKTSPHGASEAMHSIQGPWCRLVCCGFPVPLLSALRL